MFLTIANCWIASITFCRIPGSIAWTSMHNNAILRSVGYVNLFPNVFGFYLELLEHRIFFVRRKYGNNNPVMVMIISRGLFQWVHKTGCMGAVASLRKTPLGIPSPGCTLSMAIVDVCDQR